MIGRIQFKYRKENPSTTAKIERMMAMRTHQGNKYTVSPVGYVEQVDGKVLLMISEPYRPGMKELETFSHAQIFWWAHELDDEACRQTMQVDPPYDAPVCGVFANRSPVRPNPIGLTTVRLLSTDEANGKIEIAEIDAYPGTPILDIKAYIPCCDRVKDVKVAKWAEKWPMWLPEGE